MSAANESFDHIVVGAGLAGCVLADRLSASSERRVLVLEAGPADWSPLIKMPLGEVFTVGGVHDWQFKTEPEAELGGSRVEQPRGKVLGGSSSINGQLYVRGHSRDYDEWAQLGNTGWSYEDVLPLFKRAEHWRGGEDQYRGGGGQLQTAFGRYRNPLYEAFLEAGRTLGYPVTDDYNGAEPEGFCWSQYTHTHGFPLRCSAATAYLRPARRRANLTIRTRARATSLCIEGARCVGVDYVWRGERRRVHCDGEVIVASGAYQSPQLLMLSGIGKPETLRAHGIEVKHDLPGVGENLQDHYGSLVQHECIQPITLYSLRNPLKLALAIGQLLLARSGPLSVFPTNVKAFIRSDRALERPDLQLMLSPLALSPDSTSPYVPKYHGYSVQWCVLRPHSVGHVTLRSADPLDTPVIVHNYLADAWDRRLNRAALRLAREILAQAAFDPFRGPEIEPGPACTSDADIDAYMIRLSAPHYHPAGSCKMGTDDRAVVDPSLRVHGIAGLRVADASIMPRVVGGNTNAPTIMIGEKAAELILGSVG